MNIATLDARDEALADARMTKIADVPYPRVGDYMRLPDGTMPRIAYVWPNSAQPAIGGSFYLGNYGCSFSGSLDSSIALDNLMLTDERRMGVVWVFHHDIATAHNGVTLKREFRVYEVLK